MATFLAHLRVKPGQEAEFERTAVALRAATLEHETGMLRYEYWRGREPGTYYTLASFEDFDAFIEHQTSEHHESIGKELMTFVDDMTFEWVDPITAASPLPSTDEQPLPVGAGETAARYHERFAIREGAWWKALRLGG